MKTFALAGNPNTGKTSLFNKLTGSYEYIGNWTGVTVEKKIGRLRSGSDQIVDLPGIYSLTPITEDEGVASRFLLTEPFAGMINIVDASQLKRNLYLTIQLLEYGKPLLIGLNMLDVAQSNGFDIDSKQLSKQLKVPIFPMIARTGQGVPELSKSLSELSTQETTPLFIDYGDVIEDAITQLLPLLPNEINVPSKRWVAIQYLEGNQLVQDQIRNIIDTTPLDEILRTAEQKLQQETNKVLCQQMHRARSEFITQILSACTIPLKSKRRKWGDQIDSLVTNRFLGIPIFLAFMYLMFKLTFEWLGQPLSDLLDAFINETLNPMTMNFLASMNASPFIQDVITQGIFAGVGGVLVFVPQIFILFFMISFIEDSGYMARVTMVMDRVMHAVGLNGKAFIPMIIGFGCNVPGVMATRTIENPKERLITILINPLMSCSARLTVYSLFVGTFFQKNQAGVVFSLYLLGIIVSLTLAKLFSLGLLKSDQSMFVVELPPYRVPQWTTLMRSTWEKGKGFIRKAGTFIFGGSVLIWLLSYTGPSGIGVEMNESFLAMIGGVLAPLLSPLGFGNWQAGAALLTGFLAKEVVVSTMNIIYAAPDMHSLQGVMTQFFTPLQAYSFMAFVLLYVPCLATVAVIRKETNSTKWTWFAVLYALLIAYVVSLVIYQGGKMIGLA